MLASDKAAVWQERLRRYERAGLTVAEFCQRERVSIPSFYQWRKRLAETSAGPRPGRSLGMQRPATAPAFQQVMLSAGGVVAIELPSGVRLELPAGQLPLVRAVLADLLRIESGSGTGDA
jgi:hypothetical protein